MVTDKRYITILTNTVLALLGGTIAYLTDWFLLIPLLFGLGIPLVNAQGTLKQKVGKTFVIEIVSVALFLGSFVSVFLKFLELHLAIGFVVGVCGLLYLGIHALLIETVKFNLKSSVTTVLLTSFTFIAWALAVDRLDLENQSDERFLRQFGPMVLWMTAVTIGIVTGIKKEKTSANNA